MLEELVEQHHVEGLCIEGHHLGLDVTAGDVEAQRRDRLGKALRPDVNGAEVVAELGERAGEQKRYRTVLQDAGSGLDLLLDDLEVYSQPLSVLATVLRKPLFESGILRLDAGGDLVDQGEVSLLEMPRFRLTLHGFGSGGHFQDSPRSRR